MTKPPSCYVHLLEWIYGCMIMVALFSKQDTNTTKQAFGTSQPGRHYQVNRFHTEETCLCASNYLSQEPHCKSTRFIINCTDDGIYGSFQWVDEKITDSHKRTFQEIFNLVLQEIIRLTYQWTRFNSQYSTRWHNKRYFNPDGLFHDRKV